MICLRCGSELWDNRNKKKTEKSPDFKCKSTTCATVFWFKNGELKAPKSAGPIPQNQFSTAQASNPAPIMTPQRQGDDDRQRWIQWGQSLNLAVQVKGNDAKVVEIRAAAEKFFEILSTPPWLAQAPKQSYNEPVYEEPNYPVDDQSELPF